METSRSALAIPRRETTEAPLALVMDDEPELRALVCGMLETMGYAVKSAVNGTEGLKVYEEFAPQIEVVMLDIAMPGLSSHQVLGKIRESGPQNVRVFVMSGYSEGDAINRCGAHRPEGFLAKPFSAARLKAALQA